MAIGDNVLKVQTEIHAACKAAGRNAQEITLIAVTKTAPVSAIEEAISAGIKHVAENRVQEAQLKFPGLKSKYPDVCCHLIGHLQTNKAKDVIAVCQLVQSVDSLKLAQEINKHAAKLNKAVDVLVQFNTAREPQKFGADPQEAFSLIEGISSLSQVRVLGLMAMAPYTEDQGVIRRAFADLRGLRDAIAKRFAGPKVELKFLSMGMSSDYRIALEEGSNMVRIGSAIFK